MKLGCVSYINALPLISYLDPKETEILLRPPAQLLRLLDEDEVDAALLPIVNYFESPHLYLVPDIAIAAQGAVQSVKLFLHDPSLDIKKVKRVYLDEESRTSQVLLKIFFQNLFSMDLNKIQFLSDQNSGAEASLLIGDKALNRNLDAYPSYDLAELWWNWTHTPFVFAAWMTKKKQDPSLIQTLQKSREIGLKNISKIIKKMKDYPEDFLKEYFTNSIRYYMGSEALKGIQTFYEYLKPIEGYANELHFRFVS